MARTTMESIQRGMAFAHDALKDAREGTNEQLHFVPPGGSHSIAWCLWHTMRAEDLMNAWVQGGAPTWDESWAEKTGLPLEGFGVRMTDAEAQDVRIRDMEAFAAFQDAVWNRTMQFLERHDDAEMEREIQNQRGTETVAEAYMLHMIGHLNGHRGEINMLRGMQGLPTVLADRGTF